MGWFSWLRRGLPQAAANTITTSRELAEVFASGVVDTRAGVPVTPQDAMRTPAVASAVGILAESVAQVPLILYRRVGDGKERATDHPLWSVLSKKPNGWQGTFAFREYMQTQLALYGNAYAFKNMVGGRLFELLPLHPNRVAVDQDDNWNIKYRVSLPGGKTLETDRSRIFHITDRSFDSVVGSSRVRLNRDAIGLTQRLENYGSSLFGNGARPDILLHTEQNLSPEAVALIRDSWKSAHGGDNVGGVAVMDSGIKAETMSMTSTDAQFLENRKFQIAECARIWRIPPHMIGDLEKATFSNIEQQSLEFVKYTLVPWWRRWEDAVNTQLIDDPDLFVEFLADGLLRGTQKERYESYQVAIQNGWMTRNEVRVRENLNPIEGGDEITPATNLFPSPGGDDGNDQPAE